MSVDARNLWRRVYLWLRWRSVTVGEVDVLIDDGGVHESPFRMRRYRHDGWRLREIADRDDI